MDETEEAAPALIPERVGDRLRAARLKAGVDLSDIATKTRIPLRHLTAIEAGEYESLPAITYCLGFVRSYARAVGEDEVVLATDLRTELGLATANRSSEYVDYDTPDSVRLPSKAYAWTALGLALLVALGWGILRGGYLTGGASPVAENVVAQGAATGDGDGAGNAVVAAAPGGAVVLTATDKVWLRIYDKNNKTVTQAEMAPGQSFEIPATVEKPMIRTRLPHKIKITIGGKEVMPLGTEEKLIKDVEISAAALNARPAPPPPPSAANAATPGVVPPSQP